MTQEQKLTCPRALRSTSVFLTICLVLFVALSLQARTGLAPGAQAAPKATISVIADGQMGPGARHGISKVRLALEEKGIQAQTAVSLETAQGNSLLVLGLSGGSGPAAMLLDSLGVSKPTRAESLLVRQKRHFVVPQSERQAGKDRHRHRQSLRAASARSAAVFIEKPVETRREQSGDCAACEPGVRV